MGVRANLPSKMTEDVRGGTRGGRDRFSWDTLKSDPHRANYLGNSVRVPGNRFDQGKRDPFWYERSERIIALTSAERKALKKEQSQRELEETKRLEEEAAQELAQKRAERNVDGQMERAQRAAMEVKARLQAQSDMPESFELKKQPSQYRQGRNADYRHRDYQNAPNRSDKKQ